jgi:predicted O-methyltransferase YrrM
MGATGVEIGAHLGASTCYLAAGLALNGGRLFSIDTWLNDAMPEGRQDTYDQFRWNTRFISDRVVPVRKRSETLLSSDISVPLALAFIDGDHSYEAVRGDFVRVADWVAPAGLVAFHDASARFPGVSRTIGEALATGTWTFGGRVHTLTWVRRLS